MKDIEAKERAGLGLVQGQGCSIVDNRYKSLEHLSFGGGGVVRMHTYDPFQIPPWEKSSTLVCF